MYILFIYIYMFNIYVLYTHTYKKELCRQIIIYNEETQCTSQTPCFQVLELHFQLNFEFRF